MDIKCEESFLTIKNILVEFTGCSPDYISSEKKLRSELHLDSIAMVNLQIAIEDRFDIRFNPIEDDFAEIFETVGSLVSYVKKTLKDGM